MERLFKAMIVVVAVAMLLIVAAWLFLRHQTPPPNRAATQPVSVAPAPDDINSDDPCREAIVLTPQSHSGVSALITAQTPDRQDTPTQDSSAKEGRLTA